MDRYRSLLYTLLTSNKPCSGTMLSRIAGVSPKTLRKDIQEINEILESKKVYIKSRTGVGYEIEYREGNAFYNFKEAIVTQYLRSQFYKSSQRNRIHYIIRYLLSFRRVSLVELADKMYYSDSVILRDLKLVKKELKIFDIEVLQSAATGLTLRGSEWDIRMCIIYELRIYLKNNMLVESRDEAFETPVFGDENLNLEYLKDFLMDEFRGVFCLSLEHIENIAAWIMLSSTRSDKTEFIQFKDEKEDGLTEGIIWEFCEKLYRDLKKQKGIKYQREDVLGLVVLIKSYHEESIDLNVPIKLFDEKDLTLYMEQYFPNIYPYDEKNEELHYFFRVIEHELYRILFRQKYHNYIHFDQSKGVHDIGLYRLTQCSCMMEYFRVKCQFYLTEYNLSQLYYIITEHMKNIDGNWKIPVKILFVSAYERINRKLMKDMICKTLPFSAIKLRSISYMQKGEAAGSSYDYIVTDCIESFKKEAENIPVVLASIHIAEVFPTYTVGQRSLSYYVLSKIFRKELFFKADTISSRKEAFSFMREHLLPCLDISDEYIREIENQENILSYERINRMITIMPYTKMKIPDFFSVICCKKTFIWRTMECRFIFITSFTNHPEEYEILIDSALRGLMHDFCSLNLDWNEMRYERVLEVLSDCDEQLYNRKINHLEFY